MYNTLHIFNISRIITYVAVKRLGIVYVLTIGQSDVPAGRVWSEGQGSGHSQDNTNLKLIFICSRLSGAKVNVNQKVIVKLLKFKVKRGWCKINVRSRPRMRSWQSSRLSLKSRYQYSQDNGQSPDKSGSWCHGLSLGQCPVKVKVF